MRVAPPRTVVAWLAAVVRAHGARPAMRYEGLTWSYRDLWDWSASIARRLLGEPAFRPAAAVGLVGRNTPDYLAAYLGVLRAGGMVVPLNERLTAEDLAGQLALVEAAGVLTGGLDGDRTETLAGAVPVWPIAGGFPSRGARSPRISPGSAACTLLTSGTTGTPKGVLHSHATLLHAGLELARALPLRPGERSIVFLPFHASIPEQVLPVLFSGGALDIIERFDPDRIAAACDAGATSFDAVPTLMARLLDGASHDALRRLRWVSFASEPMPVALLERWWDAMPGVETHQFYGMTECLPITYAGPDDLSARPDTVGRPYPTSEVAVVDPSGRPVAPGESGEVVCRTPARMAGYLGDAAATAAATTGRGAMRTGDLATFTDDGYLLLTGRLKDLIISGGFNVAPAEIEAVACRHPAVASAVVVGIPDARWGETPVVVAVPQPGAELAPGDILGFCREALADFKRPSAAALVDQLPLTGIGKSAKGLVRQQILKGELALVRAG